MSDYAAAVREFAQQSATERQSVWPARVQLAAKDGEPGAKVRCTKSITKITRVPQEQGAGWVQRALATFGFLAAGSFVPDIGAEFTLVEAPIASEVGTRWRCFDLARADASGSDHRCVCYRLD